MQVFTIVRNTTGEGKDLKTEYQIAGNVSLLEAQQMLTEAIIASAKSEGSVEARGAKKASKSAEKVEETR